MGVAGGSEIRRAWRRGSKIALCVAGLLLIPVSAHAVPGQTSGSSDASSYYEDALVLSDQGELRAAVIQLKNALGRDPEHLAARLLLGEMYTKLGFATAAIDAFETAVALGADDGLVVVPLFRAHLLARNYQKILADIDLDARPRSIRADLLVIRGHARLELGNYADAEKDFREAETLSPHDGSPLVGRALVAFNRGDYKRAEAIVEAAIKVAPDNAPAWFVKGEIKRSRVIAPDAIENYTRALEFNPHHYKARLARAALFIDSRKFDEARADLDFLKTRGRNDPQIAYFNALILLQTGEWQDAGEVLNRALAFAESQTKDRGPVNPRYTLLAGIVRLLKGDQEQAYRLLSDHVDLVPDDPAGRMILGRVLIMMNEPARALTILDPVRRLDPESPELYALMGVAHMRLGNYADALQYLDAAIARATDVVPFQMEIVRMNIREGEAADARRRLDEILKLDPESIEANYTLAYLEINNRNYAAARNYSRKMMETAPENPTGFNLDGIILLSEGHVSEARTAFDKAHDIAPLFFSASHNLAQLDLAGGHLDRARSRYETFLQASVKDIRPMIELARIAKYEGKWVEAIDRLEKVRSLRPDAWRFWMELIDLYLRLGDEPHSLAVVEQLEHLAPDDVGVVVAVGRAELIAGNKDDARRTFGRAAVYAKNDPDTLREIAKYMILAGGLEEAENILRVGLRIAPDHIEIHASLVALYANQDRFDDAIAHAQYVRKTWPASGLGYMLIGDIHMRKGAWSEAVAAYDRASRKEPVPALAMRTYQAAIALRPNEKGWREALNRLRGFSEKNPGNRIIEQTLASAMSRVGDHDGAHNLLQKLLSQDPEDVAVLNNLALLYVATDDPRAVDMARRAYALAPEEAAVLDTLGWALTWAGEPEEALGYLREAGVRAIGFPDIHYHLAVALNDLGRSGEALREVRLALKTDAWFDGRTGAQALVGSLSEN